MPDSTLDRKGAVLYAVECLIDAYNERQAIEHLTVSGNTTAELEQALREKNEKREAAILRLEACYLVLVRLAAELDLAEPLKARNVEGNYIQYLLTWQAGAEGRLSRLECEDSLDGRTYDEKDVPAEFREEGKADGVVLTTSYLGSRSNIWELTSTDLSKARAKGLAPVRVKVRLKKKVGAKKDSTQDAYRFDDVKEIRRRKTRNEDKR